MKFFKYLGIISIMVFSFYYTDKIANFVLEKNKLYQEIDKVKDNYRVSSVSATIDNEYIIPGLMGKVVNVKDSYYNMKNLEVFNEYYLVYSDVYPDVSLDNNIDKIIKQGNPFKNSIALVIENDQNIINYLVKNKIKADVLITLEEYYKHPNLELINNDKNNYDKLESLLNNSNLNKNLCIINNDIEEICRKNKKYLITTEVLDNNSFLNLKNNIQRGNIYLVKKEMNLENLKLFIKDIKFKDLNIVYLSDLISEEN